MQNEDEIDDQMEPNLMQVVNSTDEDEDWKKTIICKIFFFAICF